MDPTGATQPRLLELTLRQFVDAVASSEAAPGGGSAAALAGALGSALAAMVAGLTVGRRRYTAHHDEMCVLLDEARTLQARLLSLVEADTAAYERVMSAYRLPKETDEQQMQRTSAIQAALRVATEVPLATAEASARVLGLAAAAASRGNRNAASDAAVAALLSHAALHGAVRNVRINLASIDDGHYRSVAEARVSKLAAAGDEAIREALSAADQPLP